MQVEKNTEPLTRVIRFNPCIKKTAISNKLPIDPAAVFSLIVQLSYLLYTCVLQKRNILVGGDIWVNIYRRGDSIPIQ